MKNPKCPDCKRVKCICEGEKPIWYTETNKKWKPGPDGELEVIEHKEREVFGKMSAEDGR